MNASNSDECKIDFKISETAILFFVMYLKVYSSVECIVIVCLAKSQIDLVPEMRF